MMKIKIALTGIFPRDDALIKIWKDYEWNRVSKDILEDRIYSSTQALISLQHELGYDYISYPMLEWHDLFRPFTSLDNVKEGPLTRFFETNTFYRQPILVDRVRYNHGLLTRYIKYDLLPKNVKCKISLPGPYTFYRLSSYDNDMIAIESIKNIIIGSLEELCNNGIRYVDLHEPGLAYFEDIEWDIVNELYKDIKFNNMDIYIVSYFGSIMQKERVFSIDGIRGVQIDIYSENMDKLNLSLGKTLSLGILNCYNTIMEDSPFIFRRLSKLINNLDIDGELLLSNNSHLDYLPYKVALRKMEILSMIKDKYNG
jgi:5-methyltetrahydropteroyltriglutamate--homocysteine methyltransferase